MLRADCYLSFAEALELYFQSRAELPRLTPGSGRHSQVTRQMTIAIKHMDALTDSTDLRSQPLPH